MEAGKKKGGSIISFFKKQPTSVETSANAGSEAAPAAAGAIKVVDLVEVTEVKGPENITTANKIASSSQERIPSAPSRSVHPLFIPKVKPSPTGVAEIISVSDEPIVVVLDNNQENGELDVNIVPVINNLGAAFERSVVQDQELPTDCENADTGDTQPQTNAPVSGRPRRQAAVDAAEKQQQQKAALATVDRALRTGGRILEKKRKNDDSDDDFVEKPKGKPKTADLFLSKEEKAKRKQEEAEQLRIKQLQEQEIERIKKIAEQEAKIRQQFKEDLERKERDRANFGAGVNPFFQQQFQSKAVVGSEKVTDTDHELNQENILFPRCQHVGLPPTTATSSITTALGPRVVDVDRLTGREIPQSIEQHHQMPDYVVDLEAGFGDYLFDSLNQFCRSCQGFAHSGAVTELLESDDDEVVHMECVDLTLTNGSPPAASDKVNNASATPQISLDFGASRHCIKRIMNWMEVWAGKRRELRKSRRQRPDNKRQSRSSSRGNAFDTLMSSAVPNILHVIGPSGLGKTAMVHACAKQAGFTVIEVNTSHERKGADVRKLVAEAFQSHGLTVNWNSETASSATPGQQLNLILFDEADIVFDEETSFHSAIAQMAKNMKCPIVLTSETSLSFLRQVESYVVKVAQASEVEMRQSLAQYLSSSSIEFAISKIASSQRSRFEELCRRVCAHLTHDMPHVFNFDTRASVQTIQSVVSGALKGFKKLEINDNCHICWKEAEKWLEHAPTFTQWALAKYGQSDLSVLSSLYQAISSNNDLVTMARLAEFRKDVSVPSVLYRALVPRVASVTPPIAEVSNSKAVTIRCDFLLQKPLQSSEIYNIKVVVDGILCRSRLISGSEIECQIPLSQQVLGVHRVSIVLGQMGQALVSSSLNGLDGILRIVDDIVVDKAGLCQRQLTLLKKLLPLCKMNHKFEGEVELWKQRNGVIDAAEEEEDAFYNAPSNKKKQVKRSKKSGGPGHGRPKSNPVFIDDDDDFVSTTPAPSKTPDLPVITAVPVSEMMDISSTNASDMGAESMMTFSAAVMSVLAGALGKTVMDERSDIFLQAFECEEYLKIISRAMDMSLLTSQLVDGFFSCTEGGGNGGGVDVTSFVRDVRLMWTNCFKYNGLHSKYSTQAMALSKCFDDVILKGFVELGERAHLVQQSELVDVSHDAVIRIGESVVFERLSFENDDQLDSKFMTVIENAPSEFPVMNPETEDQTQVAKGFTSWRSEYSELESECVQEDKQNLWMLPTPLKEHQDHDHINAVIDALDDYGRLLDGYGDADIIDRRGGCQVELEMEQSGESVGSWWLPSTRLQQTAASLREAGVQHVAAKTGSAWSHCRNGGSSSSSSSNKSMWYLDSMFSLCDFERGLPSAESNQTQQMPSSDSDANNDNESHKMTVVDPVPVVAEPEPQPAKTAIPTKPPANSDDDEVWDENDDNDREQRRRTKARIRIDADDDDEDNEDIDENWDDDTSSIDSFGDESDQDDGAVQVLSNHPNPAVTGNEAGRGRSNNSNNNSSNRSDLYYGRSLQLAKDIREFDAFAAAIKSLRFQQVTPRALIVDIIPMLGRMAQYEHIRDCHRALGICDDSISSLKSEVRSRRVTRTGSKSTSKFQVLSTCTGLSTSQLDKLLVFGFIGTRSELMKRSILPNMLAVHGLWS